MNAKEFWQSMKRDDNGCLVWTRGKTGDGYGRVWWNGKHWRAHRVAWTLTNGEIPDGYELHHSPPCKKTCCDVTHLSLLTNSEHARLTNQLGQIDYSKIERARGDKNGMNLHPEARPRGDKNGSRIHLDKVPRGDNHYTRAHPEKVLRGEKNANAKITDEQTASIPVLRKQGLSQSAIGKMLGISQVHVGRIERGECRK